MVLSALFFSPSLNAKVSRLQFYAENDEYIVEIQSNEAEVARVRQGSWSIGKRKCSGYILVFKGSYVPLWNDRNILDTRHFPSDVKSVQARHVRSGTEVRIEVENTIEPRVERSSSVLKVIFPQKSE